MILHKYLQLSHQKSIIQKQHNKLMLKYIICLNYTHYKILYTISLAYLKQIIFIKPSLKLNICTNNQRKDHRPLKTSYNNP